MIYEMRTSDGQNEYADELKDSIEKFKMLKDSIEKLNVSIE